MKDCILLRFRELTQGIQTIEEHNKIARKEGHVLWGWWKKNNEPSPDPSLEELALDLMDRKNAFVYFVNADTEQYYKSQLSTIYYTPGQTTPCPNKSLCPDYYEERELVAWFCVGIITEISKDDLHEYVLSRANRTTSDNNSIPPDVIGNFLNDTTILNHPVSLWFICKEEEFESLNTECVLSITNGSYHTKGKYILHLSDLHFGDYHAYRNPLAKGKMPSKEFLFDELISDLKSIEPDIVNNIGLILVTGDLTWRSDPHEFSNASAFFEQLRIECGLSSHHIVVVPGNHDIEWLDSSGKIDDNAELNYRNFYQGLYNSRPTKTLLKIIRYNVENSGQKYNLCVIGLNSCRLESEENAGYGYVGRDQLRIVQEYLDRNKDGIDYIIAVLHHHVLPVNYIEDFDPQSKRISLLLDSESVIQLLCSYENKACAILHGHQHQPYFSQIRRIIPGYIKDGKRKCIDQKVCIIGAGSLGVNQSKTNTIGRNSYNLLSIDKGSNLLSITNRVKGSNGVGFFPETPIEIDLQHN